MDLSRLFQEIDWSLPYIQGCDLDYATYEQKFKQWDYVVENRLLETDPKDKFKTVNDATERKRLIADFEAERNRALLLLDDITIYAYAFLRNDDGEPFRLTAYQDLIGNLHHDYTHDNENRFILFRAANQLGKSLLLCALAIKLAFNSMRDTNIVMISKSLPQSQFLLAQIRHTLRNSAFSDTWKEEIGETANTTMLTFSRKIKHGKERKADGTFTKGKDLEVIKRIICAPAGEGTLGFPVHHLFLDEADFYEDAKVLFWKVFKPRTNKTKGQIILFSNPNPTIPPGESLLHELWGGDLFTRKFKFRFLDAPWGTHDEYEKDKRNTPSHIFASTHDAEFPDVGGTFLNHAEIRDMLPRSGLPVHREGPRNWQEIDPNIPGRKVYRLSSAAKEFILSSLPPVDRPVYIGADVGKSQDNTVIGVGITLKPKDERDMYRDLDCVWWSKLPLHTDYSVIEQVLILIRDFYKEKYHGVLASGIDATGQKTFSDYLHRAGFGHKKVDYSRRETNKTLLFNDLKLMAENRKVRMSWSSDAEKQFTNLVFKESETKKLRKVENKSAHIHDDIPNMLAVLINVAVKPHKTMSTAHIIGPEESEVVSPSPQEEKSLRDKYLEQEVLKNNSWNREFQPYGAY